MGSDLVEIENLLNKKNKTTGPKILAIFKNHAGDRAEELATKALELMKKSDLSVERALAEAIKKGK